MTDDPATQAVDAPEKSDGDAPLPLAGSELLDAGVADEVLRIKLEGFEGPFEVLLYLIRAQEIDIFDIPIVTVTEQYLHFLELLREESLDVAGEFLVMAATLIQIKSRMVLPLGVEEDEDEELEEEDPRLELVEKLLEYRRFRDFSQALGDLFDLQVDCFGRSVRPAVEQPDEEEDYLEVSLYDLIKAIRSILRFVMEQPVHEVLGEGVSVDEKIAAIVTRLEECESVTWSELYRESRSKIERVCCLLAILELCRMGRIRAHQHRSFGDIRIFARQPDDASAPPADVVAT